MTCDRLAVVKVGGSLLWLPDLADRLSQWLARRPERRLLLVPGGGPFADAVRAAHSCHGLTESASHGLAIRAMGIVGDLLRGLLPASPRWRVLDAEAFAASDDFRSDSVPHTWAVTSDSIALRVGLVTGAGRVALLKSADAPAGSWIEAARAGMVDDYFPTLAARPGGPVVEWVNFRSADLSWNENM